MALAQLDIYSHGVKFSQFGMKFAYVLGDYLRIYCLQTNKRRDARSGRMITEALNTFAAARSDYSEVYILKEQLDSFYQFAAAKGFQKQYLNIIEHTQVPGKPITLIKIWPYTFRPDQQDWLDYMIAAKDDPDGKKFSLNTAQTGKGKLQSLDSLIKVPGGWKRMGDLVVGDIITAADGTPTTVTNIFEHPDKELFRVHTEDGRSTLAGREHLWKAMRPNWGWVKGQEPPTRVIDTDEMMRILAMSNNRLYIPYPESEQGEDADLPIDPYLLGALLGDGSISTNDIRFTTPDDFILNRLLKVLPGDMEIKYLSRYDYSLRQISAGLPHNPGPTSLAWNLHLLGLLGTRSNSKFIPDIYLNASHRQRCQLMQGLLDTDGYVSEGVGRGSLIYTTVSPRLSECVQRLAWSLGARAAVHTKEPFYTYKGERLQGQLAYNIAIRYHGECSDIVSLPKKLDRCRGIGQYDNSMLRITEIVPEGRGDARCITIDHPDHLYVTDDYIVTHNTAMGLELIGQRSVRTAIIMQPTYFPGWRTALFGFYDFDVGDIIEIRGKDPKKPPHPKIPVYSMVEFQDLMDRGELDFKIVLISLNLYQKYITDYECNNCIAPYAFKPDEFYAKTEIGLVMHDEAHQYLHFLYKLKCYANVPEIAYLSATVESDDPFVENIFKLMYPFVGRFNKGQYDKYIVSNAVTYALGSQTKIRYKGYGGSYSHVTFEQSIMKQPRLKKAYYGFIFKIIMDNFMNGYEEDMKLLVYCATVEMCQGLSEYLTERLPLLTIGPYTSKEDFESLLDNDVSVTTVKSAGTGIDLPNLVMTFMTLAMGSRSGNIQVLGRLRKLKGKFEELTPNFYYLVCRDIEAHRKYHLKKVDNFSDKVLTQRIIDTDFEL